MSDGAPWVVQVFERERRIARFQAALETIASREPQLDVMAPDQALATLREFVSIARSALEQYASVPGQHKPRR